MSLPSALFLARSLFVAAVVALGLGLGLPALGRLGALLAFLALLGLGLGVGLGVLLLELLERGGLGLGPLTGLLLAALLLGLGLEVGLARAALRREGHAQPVEQGERLLVRLGGGCDRHVEAADLVDRVVVDLREDDLLADAQRIVAAAVEGPRVEPA